VVEARAAVDLCDLDAGHGVRRAAGGAQRQIAIQLN
jgi:hypothetical protein